MKYDVKTPYEAYLVARIKKARHEALLELLELVEIVEDLIEETSVTSHVAQLSEEKRLAHGVLVRLHGNISAKISARKLIDKDEG